MKLDERSKGWAYGVSAYLAWGAFPVYFKWIAVVPPLEILAHRIAWSFLVLLAMLPVVRRGREVRAVFRNRKALLFLCGSAALIAVNWLLFVIAVAADRVLESSLGYFINPLVSVLLGRLFLSERLRGAQRVSLLLAAAGVALVAAGHDRIPWISLGLAVTFAFYGLLRKTAPVGAFEGLFFETALLAPAAAAFLAAQVGSGRAVFLAGDPSLSLLLPLSGVITAFPLIGFAAAARRMRLSTLGFLQFLTPSGHFLLAVFLYGEPFGGTELLAFLLIWTGLAVYSIDIYRKRTEDSCGSTG